LQGPTGQNGNANVMQYIYEPTDGNDNPIGIDMTKPGPDSNYLGLLVPVGNDTADKAAWFAYWFTPVDSIHAFWTAIPGAGFDNQSTYNFTYGYIDDTSPRDSCAFFITRTSGPGEVYLALRLVRILISNVSTNSTGGSGNRRGLPNIDFSNYEEVKKYYHLQ
jgi:hypothetical protein